MASRSFLVEDQTDEDFFDKLVDDGVDGCGDGFSEDGADDDARVFADLSVKEIGLDSLMSVKEDVGEKNGENGVILDESGVNGENVGVENVGVGGSSDLVDTKSVNEFVGGEADSKDEFNADTCNDTKNVGGGIKEVQWSAFDTITKEASDTDFFSEIGDNVADSFGEVAHGISAVSDTTSGVSSDQADGSALYDSVQKEENVHHGSSSNINAEMQETNSVEFWESLYPGWKYDPYTGQWYQLNGSDASVSNGEIYNANGLSTFEVDSTDPKSNVHHLQATESVTESVTEESTTATLSTWNQSAEGSSQYPAHMVFDPQYPGWYYDTIAQEWRSLDSYNSSINSSTNLDQNQHMSNSSFSTSNYYEQNMGYGQGGQGNSYPHQNQLVNWNDFGNNHHQQEMNVVQTEQFDKNEASGSTHGTYFGNGHVSSGQVNYSSDLRTDAVLSEEPTLCEERSRGLNSCNGNNGFSGFSSGVSGFCNPAQFSEHNNQHNKEFDQQSYFSKFSGTEVQNFSQQTFLSNGRSPYQSSYATNEGKSTAGRPPHALVAFGFGGKLIVMKDQSTLHVQSAYINQDSAGSVINIINMMDLTTPKSVDSDMGSSACAYFHTLCQHSLPGPLVSGSVGNKEVHKWIDERIANCDTSDADYRKTKNLKMLFSLLKIACQYYGKLRSAFGADLGLKEQDCPETALANLFVSGKRNGTHCLYNMPSGEQMQATADEVQMLLISGKRMEALQCAQVGHLWGPAIVIAALLGEQFYGETVKQMAFHQFVAGSPLRTLCLLLAGQPAEVFANLNTTNLPIGFHASQQVQAVPSCMLDEWEENLAVITVNRTKGDELVITHLGDCLWKERSEVTAAHICYLVAEANVEPYSESARLCLIGADHLKYPRTFASPETIQRTELYEYAKVLGNSQCVLLPFQPYKIIYATMLVEAGKLSESLKYCQAVLKALKAGRSPEVDAWRYMASSLEERIKLHLQGGYTTNLAPAKLVGKLLNFFDNTAHRVVGGLPPSAPSTSYSNGQNNEHDHQSRGPRVSTSQSTMAMSSLMSSASPEGNSHKPLQNRSISEPDFGRTPRKAESPEKANSTSSNASASNSGGSSRFGLFGTQIFQKTVGLVLGSRSDRQAKLGEKNKFYYDEKLKRWVEEGAKAPVEDAPLAPPPTNATFMNGTADHNKKVESVNGTIHANGEVDFRSANSVHSGFPHMSSASNQSAGTPPLPSASNQSAGTPPLPTASNQSAGTPPLPSASNHFSARVRMGVRARYVDTFNKGGGYQANTFQAPSPSIPATKPATSNAKFFIPTPIPGGQENTDNFPSQQIDEDATTSNQIQAFTCPQMLKPQSPLHRHPSMEGITNMTTGVPMNGNGPPPPPSRRTLSWSGRDFGEALDNNSYSIGETKPQGEGQALGFPPHMPVNASPMPFSSNYTMMAEDLQEVQL